MPTHRYLICSLLLSACCGVSAAPVPKSAPPKALTAEMVVGVWGYSWGDWPDGVISFDASGSYTAVHIPGSNTVYFGQWAVEDDTVTIHEYRHDLATNGQSGPTTYKFQFAAKDYPKLKGLSNGARPVALSKPKG